MEKENITYEDPEELTPFNVMHWSEHYKALEVGGNGKSRQSKSRKFLENGCIKWDHNAKNWICGPLEGYNKTTYHIKHNRALVNPESGKKGEFECSCQFNQKTAEMCSHILALYLFLKIYNWNKKYSDDNYFPREFVEDEYGN